MEPRAVVAREEEEEAEEEERAEMSWRGRWSSRRSSRKKRTCHERHFSSKSYEPSFPFVSELCARDPA